MRRFKEKQSAAAKKGGGTSGFFPDQNDSPQTRQKHYESFDLSDAFTQFVGSDLSRSIPAGHHVPCDGLCARNPGGLHELMSGFGGRVVIIATDKARTRAASFHVGSHRAGLFKQEQHRCSDAAIEGIELWHFDAML